jgi:tetratricopeptide (TPR) repeat protein
MGRMENANLDETKPTPLGDETIPTQLQTSEDQKPNQNQEEAQPFSDSEALEGKTPADQPPDNLSPTGENLQGPNRSRAWRWLLLLAFLALLAIAAASAFGGYRSGIYQRTSLEATQVAQQVEEQFQLGVQDLEAQRYEVARQRFEYVIQLDPDYPGVTEKLADVLLELNTTATPTKAPTATLSPTPDLRGAEELFSQSQMLLADHKWSEAIDTLLQLRKGNHDYQPVKVDSMLYVALRNRGVEKILNQADLEGGTYDLALAERFGPLDVEAQNYRTWADLYVTGASFWELDWSQATYYFGQLLLVAPNLRDSSNLTVTERFRIASIKYGDALAEAKEWCQAQEQYQAALNLGSDPAVEPTASWITKKCEDANKPKEEPTQVPATEAIPTPTIETTPQVTPEVTSTQEPYPPPTP